MSKERDSKKRIAFPIQLFAEGSSSVEPPSEIHVVPVGEWDHSVYGHMKIDAAAIQQFMTNYKAGIRKDLRITAGHDNGMSGGELPALGWFKDLYARDDGLWAKMDWTPDGEEAIKKRSYKYFSPEMFLNGDMAYEDPETHNVYNFVLDGGALTNFPYFKELNAVVMFSEPHLMNKFNESMTLKDILAKQPADLSEAEKAFLREHKSELNADQQSAFSSVFDESAADDDAGDEDAGGEEEQKDDAAAGEDKSGEEGKVEASERKGKTITMSEAEVVALRDMADKGAQAFAEVEKMKLEKEVEKLVFSASNAEGRILPKIKGAVVEFMFSLNTKQRDQFRNIVNNLPKTTLSFDEIGDGGKTAPASVFAEVNAKVQEAQKADAKLTYSEAIRKVFRENTDLAERYHNADGEESTDAE